MEKQTESGLDLRTFWVVALLLSLLWFTITQYAICYHLIGIKKSVEAQVEERADE